jgi:hemerythrin-like domain-containing protein
MSRGIRISEPGESREDAGFEDPFAMLAACHERVDASLTRLARIGEHVARHGADALARDAAADVMRYFDIAAPLHHEDEERHLFPRLAGDARWADEVRRLHAEHEALSDSWLRLRPQLASLHERGEVDADQLAQAASQFERDYRRHLEFEDRELFAAARRMFDEAADSSEAIEQMGREMAARRGAPFKGRA